MPGIRFLVLVLALSAAVSAQTALTSAQMVDFVRKSAKTSSDKDVAEYLKKVTLSERLSEEALDDCIKAGAGVRTRAALFVLVEQSAALPAPPKKLAAIDTPGLSVSKPVTGPRPPSVEEKALVIEKVTEYARGYIKNLPNFTSAQVTRRYYDPTNSGHFRLDDTVLERLSYFEGQESYKVVSVNNTPSTKSHNELGGTTSAGEFGTDMRVLFSRETHTEFTWDSWTTLNKRRTHKIAYRVSQEYSTWNIEFNKTERFVPGYHGFVFVDRDLNMVMRITREADDISASFPIRNVTQETRYEFTRIGDSEQEFLVPLSSVITSTMTTPKTGTYTVRNEAEFKLYNKFGVEVKLTFGDVDDAKPQPPPAKK